MEAAGAKPSAFFLVRPAGHAHSGVKVPYTAVGKCQRKATVYPVTEESEGSRQQSAGATNRRRRGVTVGLAGPEMLRHTPACGAVALNMLVQVWEAGWDSLLLLLC
jgi:hypothetical protein